MRHIDLRLIAKGFVLLLLSAFLCNCAFVSLKNWFEFSGTVLYKDIEKPVPNAMIAAVWRGENHDLEGNPEQCYHVKTAKTGNDGAFQIPGWREYFDYGHLRKKSVSIIVYKPGFWSEEILHPTPNLQQGKYFIETASDDNHQTTPSNRLKYLLKMVGFTGCELMPEDRVTLTPLYAAILAEAKSIAESPAELQLVASLKTWTAFVTPEEKAEQARQAKQFKPGAQPKQAKAK